MLAVDAIFDPDADPLTGLVELVVTIAVTPAEADSLSAGLADSATITLATGSEQPGEFAIMIQMQRPQALQGQVRRGDVVNVVSVASLGERRSDPVLLANNVHVLTASQNGLSERPETYFWIFLSVTSDELLTITAAAANGQLALEQ